MCKQLCQECHLVDRPHHSAQRPQEVGTDPADVKAESVTLFSNPLDETSYLLHVLCNF